MLGLEIQLQICDTCNGNKLSMAGATANKEAVAEMLAQPDDDPTDLEALDEVWEDSEVLFGPDPDAGCPQARDMLARMDTLEIPNPTATPAPNVAAE
jgi:nitrate reductase delta subunit